MINGILEKYDSGDTVEAALFEKKQAAIENIPDDLQKCPISMVPLRACNITGIENVRHMLSYAGDFNDPTGSADLKSSTLRDAVETVRSQRRKVTRSLINADK